MPRRAKWLRIDERTDVLSSLSLCLNCLEMTPVAPANWKWAILSLHNALQGAMVCHLSGTMGLGALDQKTISEWHDWYERDSLGQIKRIPDGVDELGIPQFRFASAKDKPPRERLADTRELFERLHNIGRRCEIGAGKMLTISEDQHSSFKQLHSLRNGFAHFTPKGWSIELGGLPRIFNDMVGVIAMIAGDPWTFRHFGVRQRRLLRSLIHNLRKTIRHGVTSRKKGPSASPYFTRHPR